MNPRLILVLTLLVASNAFAAKPPNIVYILADDLGYAELSCYGQKKFKTPHIDQLAKEGMRFMQHYTGQAVCAPARCVLMTGKHTGHSYIRNNGNPKFPKSEWEKHGWLFPGQNPIPDGEVTIAELLKQKGYATAAIGKWGLGHVGTSGDPNKQGFDLFFGMNCQVHAHSYYPGHLWHNNKKFKLNNVPPVPGHASLPKGADPNDPKSYERFKGKDHATDHMIKFALDFIRENKEGPFFLYYPSPIPHVALHVYDEELKPFAGKWPETPFTGGGYTPHQTPKAAYAAMIARLDREVGQIMAELKEQGLDDNTIVIFSSDNGTTHLKKEVDYDFFESVGPLRGLKGSLYEGGIRVPMIARWPGRIKAGTQSDHISAFWDVMPTLADISGTKAPKNIDGISFAPTLFGRGNEQKKHEYLYWEFRAYGGQQAVRLGDWKGVRQNLMRRKKGADPMKIQLYNLANDIGESKDVAADNPKIAARIRQIMKDGRTPSKLFAFPLLDQQ